MSTFLNFLAKPSVTNQPPSESELSRIDLAVIVTVIFALFLGFGIRNSATTASRTVALGEGLPSLEIPNNWITGTGDGMLLYARNPRSPSNFNAELTVTTMPLPPGADAKGARTNLGLQRTQDLFRYRELAVNEVTVDGVEGMLVTYAYVADPTREQGAVSPPVVVQGQDLIFRNGENQALIVSVATDAATWDDEQTAVNLIYDSLNVTILETDLRDEVEEGGE